MLRASADVGGRCCGELGMRYGWRGFAFVLVVVLVGLGLAACAPTRTTDLHATQVACHRVDLAWTAATVPGGTVASYTVMRDGTSVATVVPPATGYSDTSVAASRSYSYSIQAFNTKGEASAVSNAVPVNTPACPPTGTMAMYCRAQKMSAQADKDQAYQRCGYVQDGIGSLCSARAKGVPAKLGYYDDLDAA